MNAIERALRDFLAVKPATVGVALVGGIAVSVRAEPRFTRDLDWAVAVDSDVEAEAYVFAMRQAGYEMTTVLEVISPTRLSTARLRRGGRGPMIDLLFAACGIEQEVVAAAEPLEVANGLVANVARVGHLIAMKLVSSDDRRRPRDREDLVQLARVADDGEWVRAEQAVRLVHDRGYARGKDLATALTELRVTSNA